MLLGKVLIVRFSSLGDIVLTSLAVRCIKKQTGARIHFMTKRQFSEILSANPYIDKIWTIDHSTDEIINDLKKENYDLIVDLHKNLRSLRLRISLFGVPSVTYFKANIAKWKAVYLKRFDFPKQPVALRYLEAVQKYNVLDDGEGLDYFIPDQDRLDVNANFNIVKPFIALVIGAMHFTKRIPLVKLSELISLIDKQTPIVLIGGPAELEMSNQLKGSNIYNLCGKLNINQSASILQQSYLVISPDTGMMHIAAALKKPIKSIWGSTLAEFGFWPFYGKNYSNLNTSFEVKDLECRPCSRFGLENCPKGHFKCMMNQDFTGIVGN